MTLVVWIAEFDGPCGLCDERIAEGDKAVYADDEPCHVECAEREGYDVQEPLL